MTDDMPLPTEEEMLEEVASIMGFDQAETDRLRLELIERHEKVDTLLANAKELGKVFSVRVGNEAYVSSSWLSTLLVIEAEHIIQGHGGCVDHLRLIDWLQTTVQAAQKNIEEELDTPDESVVD